MKLYDCKGAPNPRRMDIFLAEKGIDIEREQIDVFGGEHHSERFSKLNPACAVPVLELDDGEVIAESEAISRYFEEKQPQPSLMGEGARDQAVISMWNRRVEEGLLYAAQNYFHHATPGLKDEGRYRNAEWGEVNKKRTTDTMRWVDRELAERPYIAGDTYTIADITALCGVDFAAHIGIPIPDECQHLKAWHERVSARPSAKA